MTPRNQLTSVAGAWRATPDFGRRTGASIRWDAGQLPRVDVGATVDFDVGGRGRRVSNRGLRNQLIALVVAIPVGIWFGVGVYQGIPDYPAGTGNQDDVSLFWFGILPGVFAFATVFMLFFVMFRFFSRYVFISYARADEDYARKIRRKLRRAGIKVWMDNKLRLGDEFPSVLERKIDGCAGVVLIMSPASASSEWVEREARRAEERDKPILPILLAGQPPEWIAAKYQYFEAGDVRRSRKALISAVSRYTG